MTALLVRSFWHLLAPSIFKNDWVRPKNLFLQWNSLGILGCNLDSLGLHTLHRQFFRWQTMASRSSHFLWWGIPVLRKCEEDWGWRGNSFLQESPFHSPISSHFLWSGIPGQRKCDGNERWRRKKSFSKEFLISHPPHHVSFGQEFPTMGKERSGRREGRGGEGGGKGGGGGGSGWALPGPGPGGTG